MANEIALMQKIRLSLGKFPAVRVFRNNVGKIKTQDGRVIDFGLCIGSSDLIGYTCRTVTPDMVGKRVAIFTAIEVKGEKTKTTEPQKRFVERVSADGGIAAICRSVEEAEELCR